MISPCGSTQHLETGPGAPLCVRRIPDGWSPARVVAAWPAGAPLAALTSSGGDPRARWTILASPTEHIAGYPDAIDAVESTIDTAESADPVPFIGGWIGWVGYEAGALIEPVATHRSGKKPGPWPDAFFFRCPGAYVHDSQTDRWRTVGEARTLPVIDAASEQASLSFEVGELTSRTGEERYTADAARVIELIHAGDAFQVNLAHHLNAPFRGSARGCFLNLIGAMSPWYGAFLEHPGGLGAVCSLSPELFLQADMTSRRVLTRPIKGTRPAGSPEAELRESAKDSAELAMIVDLMRNDLGRVCEYGSVRVTDPRAIERHAGGSGVQHGVATVEGRLREGVGLRRLLGAAFPPGSITGAPKVRAMQIIDEFERHPRGPYCGAIGFVSDSGQVELNVAIRTASILGERQPGETGGGFEGEISFPVGAGLVADSDPAQEWRETLDKAAAFIEAVRRPGS